MTKELLELFKSNQSQNIEIGIQILKGKGKSELEILAYLVKHDIFDEYQLKFVGLFMLEIIIPEVIIRTERSAFENHYSNCSLMITAEFQTYQNPMSFSDNTILDIISEYKKKF